MWSSASGASGGGAPIWLAVVVARFLGGMVGGFLSTFLLAGTFAFSASAGSTGVTSRNAVVILLFGTSLIGALCTGLALHLLLPMMSSRTIGVFQATLAALCGSLVSVIVVLLVTTGQSFVLSSTSLLLIGGASIVVSALTWLGSVAVTTWMVTGASSDPTGMRYGESAPYYPYGPWAGGGQKWSDIDGIDRQGKELDDEQAERGYWGGMEDDSDDPPPAGDSPPDHE